MGSKTRHNLKHLARWGHTQNIVVSWPQWVLFMKGNIMTYQKPVWRPPLLAVAIGAVIWIVIILLIIKGC